MTALWIIFVLLITWSIYDITGTGPKLKFRTKWRARELTPYEQTKYKGKIICERTGYILRQKWRPIMVVYGTLFHFIDDTYDLTREVVFNSYKEAEEYFRNCQELGRFYSPYKFESNV